MQSALFSFDAQFALFDATPVENLFIQEFMPHANGDFVKVYLYGLMQCYHPVESASLHIIARELGMEDQAVENAMRYWEREGLVRRTGDNPLRYQFCNLKQIQLMRSQDDDGLYRYADFNKSLQNLFAPDRMLHPQEYSMVYEWIEGLGLPEEVVLMMVANHIQTNGQKKKFAFRTLDKTAQEWAKAGVRTVADVEEITRQSSVRADEIRRVYRKLGKRHAISEPDEALYRKWTETWHFDLQTILAACDETVKGTPTMGYVDGVLGRMFKEGLRTPEDLARDARADADAKALLEAIGLRGTAPNEDSRRLLQSFRDGGFTDETIELAAQRVARRGGKLDALQRTLAIWADAGAFTREQAEEYLQKIDAQRASRHRDGKEGRRVSKTVSEQNYTQREYTDEELESLFADI